MKICLLGNNLTNFVLANTLAKKKIHIDIFSNSFSKSFNNSTRTIAISTDNYKFLSENIKGFNNLGWPSEKIKIFSEKKKSNELFEFKSKNKNNFYLIKYNKLITLVKKNVKYNKFIKINNSKIYNYTFLKKKFNFIINSEQNNSITKKHFFKKIEKNYKSIAYTTLLNHKKIENKTAMQIFTKRGPLAFLPLSEKQTSVVFSSDSKLIINKKIFYDYIHKYNLKYKIKSISDIEYFNIKFSFLRNYSFKNILAFGDLIHKVHPLAGQGFNMTIRDIKILSKILEENINIGNEDGETIANIFEKKTKHLNFIYGSGIDLINSFFKIDNRLNNKLSNPIFKILRNSNFINNYAEKLSNKGIF
tara:strand:+ start:5462 stop:6544 length:1083 start_codon:yes stop_codon:yes gene_type:complete